MKFIVLFGGNSYEHEISVVSAIMLKKQLGESIGAFVFVDCEGRFYHILGENMTSKHFSTLSYKKDSTLSLCLGGFSKKKLFGDEILNGVVINLIHGKSGEDGQIPALLDFYGIKFIGPRTEGSVLSFNKELTKLYAKSRGVNVLDYAVIRVGQSDEVAKMSLPVILKPARLGSSIGISVVESANELDYALDSVFEYDDSAIVESFIPNIKEFNLAGCKIGDEFRFSIIEEVVKNKLLDFDKKYLDFRGEREIKDADITESLRTKIMDSFVRIYENCFEGAIIRCDFFVIDDEVYLNEINPVPGSLAYYLFSDFRGVVGDLAQNLPNNKIIKTKYQYISKIQSFKGK